MDRKPHKSWPSGGRAVDGSSEGGSGCTDGRYVHIRSSKPLRVKWGPLGRRGRGEDRSAYL